MSVEDRYYKVNRTLLKLIGLWPYQDLRWARVKATVITLTYLSALFVQLAVFITHKCTMDLLIKVLSFVFPTLFMIFMYHLFYLKSNTIKNIIENIYYDWKYFKNTAELDIMDNYGNTAKQFTELFLLLFYVSITVTLMSHIVPITLDIVSPTNESRGTQLHIVVEYFVDQSKYCYILIVHLTTFVSLGLITLISVGSSIYSFALHACALFKVANYRMEITMNKDVLRIPNPQREHAIHDRLVYAVNIHRRAMIYSKLLLADMERSCLFLLITAVISLSINLFRLLKAITVFKEIIDIIIPSLIILIHFLYMFLGNHVGQQITNNSDEIFYVVYSLPWYTTSVNVQKLLLFLLQECGKKFSLSVSGVFEASYEGFTMLSKLSISYFTVLHAIQ